jgi:AcrR family transcriptional regulator
MSVNGTRQQQSQATRQALIDAARALFAEHGFAGTGTEDIVRRAGVTRGALYHQFRDKEDIFRAVYAHVEKDFGARIEARMRERIPPGATAWDEVRERAQAFLDLALDREVQRIALLDAPAVLGRAAGRDVARVGLDLIRRGVLRSMERGYIDAQPIEPLARILRAAITEAASYIAHAEDHETARADAGAALDRLIEGLGRRVAVPATGGGSGGRR